MSQTFCKDDKIFFLKTFERITNFRGKGYSARGNIYILVDIIKK
jgi:hypothetical protein